VHVFFSQLAAPVRADLALVSVADVTTALGSQCAWRSVGWAKNFAAVLPSLLRFLFQEAYVPGDLSPACWRWSDGAGLG
jgi:hypothetical protein